MIQFGSIIPSQWFIIKGGNGSRFMKVEADVNGLNAVSFFDGSMRHFDMGQEVALIETPRFTLDEDWY